MIIPAILEDSFEQIRERIDMVRDLAQWVQIDLVDGVFAPKLTWPYTGGDLSDLEELPGDIQVELDLMISQPESIIASLVELPVSRVLFHFESFNDPDVLREVFSVVEATQGMSAGIALSVQTEVAVVAPFLDIVHTIQLMGIKNIGLQGQIFDETTYARVEGLRALAPDAIIEVDGGVSLSNAKELVAAGANNLVVGSGIFGSKDVWTAYKELERFSS
ncbi:MAG: hypothetical protein Q8P93_03410 [bacterium]|nr:hypothetical protein [bacterium]